MGCIGAILLVGCAKTVWVEPPKLTAYQAAVKPDATKAVMIAAMDDFNSAAEFCWTRSNNYEIRRNNAEWWRLGVGAGGGSLGFTGAMLVAAGTGGYFPGIASGLAGVSAVALSNAKDGPLSTEAMARERDAIAALIKREAAKAIAEPDPEKVFKIAVALKQSCRSGPSGGNEKAQP